MRRAQLAATGARPGTTALCSPRATATATAGSRHPAVLKVGLITKFPVDFYDTMVDAVKKYDAEHADVEVVYGQGKSGTDDEGEIAIIENMIVQGVKAIAITPTSPNVQDALDKAVAAGIKVVLVDNDIPGWTGKSSVVATDNLAGGKLAGDWLAEQDPGRVEDRRSSRAASATRRSTTGSRASRRRSARRPRSSPSRPPTATRPRASTRPRTCSPRTLTSSAIYGACGPPIIGALQAIKAAGKKPGDIVVVGFDAAPDELTAIKAGDQAASVAQFPAKMGSLGIETAVAAARGETVEATVDTGTAMVTKENAAQFQ